MTNHPNRRHGEHEPSIEPVAAGDIPPQGSAGVPAHTGNGVPPGLKPDPAALAARAVAQTLGEHLPQMLFQAVAAALSQVPVQVPRPPCATCIIQRIAWENAHKDSMDTAMTAAAQAAGAEPGSPQAAQLDLAPFLPEGLRPGDRNGIPAVAQSVTGHQGTEVCAMHLAQAAGIMPGRSPLLVANAAMSPAMLTQMAAMR